MPQARFEIGTELLATLLNALGGLNDTTITYNGDGTVNTVTDNETGAVLTLTYSVGEVASVTDGVNTWTLVKNGSNQITDINVT